MTPDNKVPSGNTPLDLDAWEADANHNIKWNIAPVSAERILALISELRQAREKIEFLEMHKMKNEFAQQIIGPEYLAMKERLKSAEEVLRFASEMVFYPIGQEEILELRCNEYNRILTPLRIIVREHFEKYASDEGEKKDGD